MGYITIPVKPVLAKEISLELIAVNSDTYNTIVEVAPNAELNVLKRHKICGC
ncbi:hypothetical protein [Formosa sp. 4Alg 33]|uniref:hypothetical protein n=1 Tax=Formosa sp. 4Alg 33 TaxID=3382189 RepID=UPI003D9C0A73